MQDDLNYQPETVLPAIQQGLRAFVGQTGFEELARQWVRQAGRTGAFGWTPQVVGSHWSRQVQVDVVAIDWPGKQILLGECKWGADTVGRPVARELIGTKAPLVLRELPNQGEGWRVSYALFTRAGASEAVRQEIAAHGGLVVDLPRLMQDLAVEDAELEF